MSDQQEQQLGAVISALMTAAFEQQFVAWFESCVPIDNLTVLAYVGEGRPRCLFAHSKETSVHASFDSAYCAGIYLLDPFFVVDRAGASSGLYRLEDIAPDYFSQSDYYLKYYRDTNILDEMTYLVRVSAELSIHICLGRDISSGRKFVPEEWEKALAIRPVAEALAVRHWSDLAEEQGECVRDGENAMTQFWEQFRKTYGVVLTARQSQTALLILRGHSSGSIAKLMGVSVQTVKVFRKQIYMRCSISSQAELFAMMMPILVRLGER
ncbi:helix-turn-helix transcriptional regulator [Gluconobacter roseus]|uniref:Helix-turn-helix transcriptional regulator n=1 Tax=Gluconobacter roseus NBRC 3990 TaxID=1307950 RepID=A0A4Y3M4C4_9PROT|nr:helix-turn-helix transcriptional regulator [Gluconobacter roseus]GBR47943.1 DNA-binding HTH domain-containing protein [Gluconobacter roseus NBRC 3990]GEB03473.1 helix-turn-helix transcriptional regulator [Gluconobacter roseus NBRC 3990]GLP93928.1 helix-turn-helix transcriptional regulator [Gluconobacter roseus NBRC 3990]